MLSKNKPFVFGTVFVLLAITLSFIKSFLFLDPDFGWHLRMGEIISFSRIPKTDPFSYSMPSFSFVDHEWLTNLLIYQLNTHLGFISLVIFYLIILFLCFVIIFRNKSVSKFRYFFFSLIVLAYGSIFPFFAVRPQVFSWLMLSILLAVLFNEKLHKKYFIWMPLFVLFWSNFHGSFATSIVTIGIFVVIKSLRLRKFLLRETIILFLCLIVTLFNPYKSGLWGEVWMQISDSALRFRIIEWKPSLFEPIMPYLIYISLAYLVFVFRKKIVLEKKVIFLFFLLQSLSSLRHIPLFIVASTPVYLEIANLLYKKIEKIKYAKQRFQKAGKIFFVISLIAVLIQVSFSIRSAYYLQEHKYYPMEAVFYLKNNLPDNNLFSVYSWGGYLIWKLPEKKLFIDGRMPSWRWNANIAEESNNAMEDYINILNGKTDYKIEFEKYNIDTVLWMKNETIQEKTKTLDDYFAKYLSIFGIKKNDFDLFEKLIEDGWKVAYEDDVSVIYQKQ